MTLAVNRNAIRSLRVGIVPYSHVLNLTVGFDPHHETLDKEFRRLKKGFPRPFVIGGEWGSGKTNLLCYISEYALKQKVAVAYINLNGRSAAINYPQKLYHRIVADIRLPGLEDNGITRLLGSIKKDSLLERKTSEWVSSLGCHSELAQALGSFINEDYHWSFQVILGSDLSWAEYRYKKEKAIKRLDDLGSYLKYLGYAGLMIQFDELESVVQLWNIASRRSAYNTLNNLSSLENVWTVFATTEKLNSQIDADAKSGRIRTEEAESFIKRYFDFQVLEPPVLSQEYANTLLSRILKLYKEAYVVSQEIRLQEVLDLWNKIPFRNPRRLIRIAIDHLDRHRLEAKGKKSLALQQC